MAKIDESTYEVTLHMHKTTIKHDLPIQIGFWVCLLAKMRMLEFYYDFLVKFFEKSKFKLSQMDTDSLYFAVGSESVEEILKTEMHSLYYRERHLWHLSEHCNSYMDEYVVT